MSEPWRFLTAAFAHAQGQPLHILFNMFALYQIGSYLEPMLGRVRFASLYLISAIGGSVGYLLLATPPGNIVELQRGNAWVIGTVGASGAVFGLFAALLVLNRHMGRSSAGIVAVLAINAVLGFVIPGIAWQAHLGGAVTGAVLAALIAVTAPRPRQRLQLPALAAVALVVVALAVAKYALSDQSFIHAITFS
jgi:membrane associated rhomboid family serine protease